MANTKISYLYRDGNNYKKRNSAILKGEYNEEDLKTIEGVQDCELFIPEQVGLPLTRPTDEYTEDDHCWAELFPENDIELTDEEPTETLPWKQLVENFKKVNKTGWKPENY